MSACFEAFAAPEVVDDFYSTALQAKSVAQKLVNRITISKDVYRLNLKDWKKVSRNLLCDHYFNACDIYYIVQKKRLRLGHT